MSQYELTVVLDGKATPAKTKAFKEKIAKLVELFKGKVVKTDDWGKKDLAYKIKKSDTGYYLYWELELGSSMAKKLGEKLRVEEEILRQLLLRKD